jgi:hypothetical protein
MSMATEIKLARQYKEITGNKGASPTDPTPEQVRLYCAVRHLLNKLFELPFTGCPEAAKNFGNNDPNGSVLDLSKEEDVLKLRGEVRLAAIIGRLHIAGYRDPANARTGTDLERIVVKSNGPVTDVFIAPEFREWVSEQFQKWSGAADLYVQAWHALYNHGQGAINGVASKTSAIECRQLSDIITRLQNRRVEASDPNIQVYVEQALTETLARGGVDSQPSSLDIDLPELDAGVIVEIIPDNVRAVQAIYFSAQLEEMKLHAVVDKVVEHFQSGMLPISRGPAADKIYGWIKDTPRRISEFERRGIYGRVLGLAMGNANEAMPNREFSELWRRFLSTVSLKYREAGSYEKDEVSVEQVHKAARDLAVNISLHGYGIAHPSAIEMSAIIREMIAMVDEQDVKTAYGVRDRWQLVDRVSALYLGGGVNGVRYRTMATSGKYIIEWLATNANNLASSSANSLALTNADGSPTQKLRDIADQAERWLAVTGTPDESLRQNADPADLQTQYTVPMLGQSSGLSRMIEDATRQTGIALPGLPAIPQA